MLRGGLEAVVSGVFLGCWWDGWVVLVWVLRRGRALRANDLAVPPADVTSAPNGGLVDLEEAEGVAHSAREGLHAGARRARICGLLLLLGGERGARVAGRGRGEEAGRGGRGRMGRGRTEEERRWYQGGGGTEYSERDADGGRNECHGRRHGSRAGTKLCASGAGRRDVSVGLVCADNGGVIDD